MNSQKAAFVFSEPVVSALVSDKQKLYHKVVMCCHYTVLYLMLNSIKILGEDICAFQGQISCCPSGKLDYSAVQAEMCVFQ